MTQKHPITPPPELVEQWRNEWHHAHGEFGVYIATQAARWGADQELEACCSWVSQFNYDDYSYQERLRAARRRSNPPSLKEQALTLLDDASDRLDAVHENTIRRALESLPS